MMKTDNAMPTKVPSKTASQIEEINNIQQIKKEILI